MITGCPEKIGVKKEISPGKRTQTLGVSDPPLRGSDLEKTAAWVKKRRFSRGVEGLDTDKGGVLCLYDFFHND